MNEPTAATFQDDVRFDSQFVTAAVISASMAASRIDSTATDTHRSPAPVTQRSQPINRAGTGIPSGASGGQGDSTSVHGESPHGSLGDAASLVASLRHRWLSSSVRIPSPVTSYVPVRPG